MRLSIFILILICCFKAYSQQPTVSSDNFIIRNAAGSVSKPINMDSVTAYDARNLGNQAIIGSLTDTILVTNAGVIKKLVGDAKINGVRVGTGGGNIASNTVIGNNAGYNNTTGNGNSFIGYTAGQSNLTGSNNSFIGYAAGYSNTASNNSFIGVQAGYNNTTGNNNSFLGNAAGFNNTSGYNNSFLGNAAGYSNTSGYNNSFLGYQAGLYNTTGNKNAFIGNYAGLNNTTGYNNFFLGNQTGFSNTTGYNNSFIGNQAGYNNTTGYNNSFLGYQSGQSNTTGSSNAFIGYVTGYYNTTGNNNSFLGYSTGLSNTTGSNNSFLGYAVGNYNTTGSNNLYVGYNSGYNNISGSSNTYLGVVSTSVTNESSRSNMLVLGTQSNGVYIFGDSTGAIGIGTKVPSYKLDVLSTANPLRLQGLVSGAATDSILSDSAGVIRRILISQVTGGNTNYWGLNGNAGTVAGTNFIGTTDLNGFSLKMNNTKFVQVNPDSTSYFGNLLTNNFIRVSKASYTSYTSDGLYGATATPTQFSNGLGGSLSFGYSDGGSGQYASRLGTQFNNSTGVTQKNSFGSTWDGAFTVGLGYNNTERLRIDSFGNVGIGTTSPAYKLDVLANANPLRLQGLQTGANTDDILSSSGGVIRKISIAQITGTNTNYWGLNGNAGTVAGTNFIGTTDLNGFSLKMNNTKFFQVNPDSTSYFGNLSTNNFFRISKSLYSSYTSDGLFGATATPSFIVNGAGFLYFGYSDGGSGQYASRLGTQFNNSTGVTQKNSFGSTWDGAFTVGLGYNNTERLRIDSFGNMGIGISLPAYKLDVNGTARISSLGTGAATDLIVTSASGVLRTQTAAQILNANAWSLTGNSGTTAGTNFIGTTDSIDLVLRTYNIEKVRVLATGNVGIGTASPAYKLDVIGDSRFNGILVGRGGGNIASNTVVGNNAGYSNTTGYSNSFIGFQAGYYNTIGNSNTCVGRAAGTYNVSGGNNTCVGTLSGTNSLGSGNTFLGNNSGNNSTAGYNTFVGYNSGRAIYSGNGNTYLGVQSTGVTDEASRSNMLAIGSQINGVYIVGDSTGAIGIGTLVPSYKLDVNASSNPLRLQGLQTGALTDDILSSSSGVVRKLSISQIANPIKAYVMARNSNTSFTSGSSTQIAYTTVVKDSTSSFSANTFTAPRSGIYSVAGVFALVNGGGITTVIDVTAGGTCEFGTSNQILGSSSNYNNTLGACNFSANVFMNAGETIFIKATQTTGITQTAAAATRTYLTIKEL